MPKSKTPGQQYRSYLRGVRTFLEPKHEEMLRGELVSYLSMADLEALFEIVMGRRAQAPTSYRDMHTA